MEPKYFILEHTFWRHPLLSSPRQSTTHTFIPTGFHILECFFCYFIQLQFPNVSKHQCINPGSLPSLGVDYALNIKEYRQQHLHIGTNLANLFLSGRCLTYPPGQLNLCFNVITIYPRFFTCYDARQEVFILFRRFKQFLTSKDPRKRFLVIRHRTWKTFRINTVHLQFFSKTSKHGSH